jgi:hypothetical protein
MGADHHIGGLMDTQERLVSESEVSAAVLGRGGKDFVLIRLDGNRGSDATALAEARSRGFFYCGALGITEGQPSAECSCPDAALTMMHAALSFAQEMGVAGRLRPKDDSARWLEELYRLPDTRA